MQKGKGSNTSQKTAIANGNASTLMSIWEVRSNLKCPIVGTCLTIEEQKRILKKSGYITKKQPSYTIHSTIMSCLGEENKVSVKTDRTIQNKYRERISELLPQNEHLLKTEWKKNFASGNIEALFYVIATRKDISDDFKMDAYGDVHMMGHANMHDIHHLKQQLQKQMELNQDMSERLEKETLRIRSLKKENKALLKRIEEEGSKSTRPLPSDVQAEIVKKENQSLKNRTTVLTSKLEDLSQEKAHVEVEKKKFEKKASELQLINDELMLEISALLSELSKPSGLTDKCDETCPQFHLCEKRILIVGGITKIKQFYQKFIESHGGEIDYHDGCLNGVNKNLEDRVLRSDLILCPVNCVSHNACSKVKRMCKKYNKPIKMLPSSSLSTISNALIENFSIIN